MDPVFAGKSLHTDRAYSSGSKYRGVLPTTTSIRCFWLKNPRCRYQTTSCPGGDDRKWCTQFAAKGFSFHYFRCPQGHGPVVDGRVSLFLIPCNATTTVRKWLGSQSSPSVP